MSDDLVKQSIAELQDLVRCRCHEAYKGRGLHDPVSWMHELLRDEARRAFGCHGPGEVRGDDAAVRRQGEVERRGEDRSFITRDTAPMEERPAHLREFDVGPVP